MAALPPPKSHISLLLLLCLVHHVAQAMPNLEPSDHDAILAVQKSLGIRTTTSSQRDNVCNGVQIFCSNNSSDNTLRITKIAFESHQLRGYLSPAIGRLSDLRELSLPHNQIGGRIPAQLGRCRKLEVLNLQNNLFSGQVPMQLSALFRLRVLDLSSNLFSGSLTFLKNFPALETLSVADNMFSGELPASLKRVRTLGSVDISGNTPVESPVSAIEDYSSQFGGNSGVPKRYMFVENGTTINQTSESAPSGSKKLNVTGAEAPSAPSAPSAAAPPTEKPKKKQRNVGGWILVFVAGVVAGSLCGLIFSVLFRLLVFFIKGGGKDTSLAIFSPEIKKADDLAFLYNEDALASFEIIGRGGCGEVYKAELSSGKTVAIKKIIQPPLDAAELTEEDSKSLNKKMRQIQSEIKIVGQIRHRNLLPVLAHLARPDCHYLVYEYMKNGSLQDILHQVEQGKRELDWLARHRTALGIAAGIEYLHINHAPRIIHRDLKPANVLLDDDMEARITDFGLAKAVPEMHTHVTTSNVAGTVGYIAPEYHQTLKFTDKCDVYSFGVLLGVLVIGKLPSDEFFQHTAEVGLVKWMRNVMTSEDPKSAIDPRLRGNGYEEQMLLVLKIACFCTLENPKERPNSKDVRLMLSQIKH